MASAVEIQAASAVAKATGTAFGDDAIGSIMAKYDTNRDGVFQVDEVRGIVNDVLNQQKMNKSLKKIVFGLMFVLIAMIGAMFAVSYAAGEAIKESHVTGGVMTATTGEIVQVAVNENELSLFELPTLDVTDLAVLNRMSLYLDATNEPTLGGAIVPSSYLLASVVKVSLTKAVFFTTSGATITVDAATQKASVEMKGTTYPASDVPNFNGRRALAHRELASGRLAASGRCAVGFRFKRGRCIQKGRM